jgi:GNAT superfamily N-acetyltransferase
MTLSIAPITSADSTTVDGWVKVARAVRDHEVPDMPPITPRLARLMLDHQFPMRQVEQYLALIDGEPAGHLEVNMSLADNLNNISYELKVAPAYRRRGVGRALHDLVLDRARATNRANLMATTSLTLPGIPALDDSGPAFATKLGYASTLPEVQRRLDLTTVDPEVLANMLAKARDKSDGYQVVQWRDTTPEEYVDDVAYLDSRLIEDAPTGDMAWEPEKVDAERIRKYEAVLTVRERRTFHTGVVHSGSGRLVAWTVISMDSEPELSWHSWQQITIVEPKHRGHRLGALVKVENLRMFREAERSVRFVDTFNAAENSYMISINEEMGFRPLYAWQNWQRKL